MIKAENIVTNGKERHLTFPNFTCHTFFDGSLFKIGNAASFLEPLEATAIALTMIQIDYASHYPLKYLSEGKRRLDENQLRAFNKSLFELILKIAFFVSWHYSMGSCFDTNFWQFSQSKFEQEIKKNENIYLINKFNNYLKVGSKINNYLHSLWSIEDEKDFGIFPVASFYEVGKGIGYF